METIILYFQSLRTCTGLNTPAIYNLLGARGEGLAPIIFRTSDLPFTPGKERGGGRGKGRWGRYGAGKERRGKTGHRRNDENVREGKERKER